MIGDREYTKIAACTTLSFHCGQECVQLVQLWFASLLMTTTVSGIAQFLYRSKINLLGL